MWAKCDMLGTVARLRLDRFKAGRTGTNGARAFSTGQLDPDQIKGVRTAVLCGLGLQFLTIHL
jgi:uncharacterized protein YifN (PemK superfamily)